jgi:MFS family permease
MAIYCGSDFGPKVARSAFAIATLSWGINYYGLFVLLHELNVRRGWSISVISAAITLHFLVSAVLLPFLSDMHRRLGIAAITRIGSGLSVAGIIMWANAVEPWQLVPAALATGSGWAAMGSAALNAMVTPWFDHDRPRALAFAMNGASVGGIVLVPLWVGLIGWLGLAGASGLIGVTSVVVIWWLAGLYLSRSPSHFGAGANDSAGSGAQAPSGAEAPANNRPVLWSDPRFVTLAVAFGLVVFAQIGVSSHLLPRLAPVLGPGPAAGMISLAMVCAAFGRWAAGMTLAGTDRRLAAAAQFALLAAGTLILALSNATFPLVLGPVLTGLAAGNTILLLPLIAQLEFKGDESRVVSLIAASNQAVLAVAPSVMAWLRDLTGSYTAPFCLAAGLQLLAISCLLWGPWAWARLRRSDLERQSPRFIGTH